MRKDIKKFAIAGVVVVLLSGCGATGVILSDKGNAETDVEVAEEVTIEEDSTVEVAKGDNVRTTTETSKRGQDVEVTENNSEKATESSGKTTERSTEGRTTEGTTEKGRESSTEGSTEKRTTEGTTERTTEASTECTEHTHTWEAVYKTVHHEATYKEEQYVVREAWDENVTESFYICNQCGRAFRCKEVDSGDPSSPAEVEFITHISECQGIGSSYHVESRVVDTIHHPAEYGTRQVVDKPAWDEQVLDYYKCKCGSTKK